MKKCRARYGVDNPDKWCRHCLRKKRCLNVYNDNNEHSSSSSEGSPTPSNPTLTNTPNQLHQQHQIQPNTSNFNISQQATSLFQNNIQQLQQPFNMTSPFFGMNPFTQFPFGFQQPIQHQQPTTPIIHPSSLIPNKQDIADVNISKTE